MAIVCRPLHKNRSAKTKAMNKERIPSIFTPHLAKMNEIIASKHTIQKKS